MTHRVHIMHETRCTSCSELIRPGEIARIPGWKQLTHEHCSSEEADQ